VHARGHTQCGAYIVVVLVVIVVVVVSFRNMSYSLECILGFLSAPKVHQAVSVYAVVPHCIPALHKKNLHLGLVTGEQITKAMDDGRAAA
jgi:hypothetical protein